MKLSLRMKLVILGGIPLALYAYMGLYMLGEQRSMFEELSDTIYHTATQVDRLILNADRDMYQSYTAYMRLESGELDSVSVAAVKKEMTENHEQAKERIASAKTIMQENDLLGLAYGQSGRTAGEIIALFETNYVAWYEQAAKAADDGRAQAINPVVDEHFQSSRDGIDEIGDSVEIYAETRISEMEEELDRAQLSTFVGVIIVSVALILMMIGMIRRLDKTIRSVVRKTGLVSQGDLTAPKEIKYGNDELGQISRAVDDMIENVGRLISGIVAGATGVNQSSAVLTDASRESAAAVRHAAVQVQEVADGSEAQARGAEEASRAMEEMAVGIGRIAHNTSVIADYSAATSAQADEGQQALERTMRQMNEVGDVIARLSLIIETLESRSQQIGEIADNITSFSTQTNILSLNASIEAARAGEQGKGFAVVAGEIRKLAAGSLKSADGIHDLVAVTRGEIAEASAVMGQTLREASVGGERIKELGRMLDKISASVVRMTEQLQENSAITEQLSASSEEVSASAEQTAATALANLEKTSRVAAATEEQLALMDNIAEASGKLDEIVRHLNGAAAAFKVNK